MIHTNRCHFCGTSFLTNAVATQHCPRCRRLLRSLRALDGLLARLARPWVTVANVLYDIAHPATVWADRKAART